MARGQALRRRFVEHCSWESSAPTLKDPNRVPDPSTLRRMQMLGHKDVRTTLRYVEVLQLDLQREFHRARQNPLVLHSMPQLPLPSLTTSPDRVDFITIRQAVAAARQLLRLFQPQLEAKRQRKLRRLSQRLLNIDHELDRLPQNECTLAG